MTLNAPQTRSRLLNVGVTLVVIAVVVPFVVFAVPQVVGADHGYVVLSSSMEPSIDAGDAVIVREVAPEAITVGDVITFRRSADILVTHRVVGISTAGGEPVFQTKGDNNEDPDPQPVQSQQLVGEVMLALPYIGYVIDFAGTTLGFALLVGLPFALLAITELWSLFSARKEQPDPPTPATRTLDEFAEEDWATARSGTEPPSVTEDPRGGEETVVTLGPGTDVTLTISTLVVLAIYSATTGIRTGFPEAYAVAAFSVFAIAGLLYITRDPGDPSPPGNGSSNDLGGGRGSRIEPFDDDGGAAAQTGRRDIDEEIMDTVTENQREDEGQPSEQERKRETPPTTGEPTVHGGDR